jgi:hypothetical protein
MGKGLLRPLASPEQFVLQEPERLLFTQRDFTFSDLLQCVVAGSRFDSNRDLILFSWFGNEFCQCRG